MPQNIFAVNSTLPNHISQNLLKMQFPVPACGVKMRMTREYRVVWWGL